MVPARRSPPTQRVMRLIDHVSTADRAMGLSELARALDISKPTCLGILNELVGGGYLVKDPHTLLYGLGPALLAVGRAARGSVVAVDLARRQLAALAARYESTCSVSAVTGESITVLAVEGPGASGTARVGQRYPFAPPVGLMYVLWDAEDALAAWLDKEPTLPVHRDRDQLREIVEQCRSTGYLVESLTPAGMRLQSLLAGVAAYDLPSEVRALVGEMVSSLGERVYLGARLNPRVEHPVSLIAAPTFSADGRQELVLTLAVGESITGAEIVRRGTALTAVAEAVTEEVGGIRPAGPTGWR